MRSAVNASVGWYEDLCALHGVSSTLVDEMWCSLTPPPPLHSDAVVVEPTVTRPTGLCAVRERSTHVERDNRRRRWWANARLSAAAPLIAAMAVGACQMTPEAITFGRWVATTQHGATDGVTNIGEAEALEIARGGLAMLAKRGRWELDDPAANELVVGQYVPSMISLDSVDGRQGQSSSEVKDSWVFEFGRPGRGALVVVDADEGRVSTMSVDP